MNNQGMPWFRLYAEFLEDYYVRTLPEVMQLRYILLLCLKCKGNVTVTDENVAWLLRITPEEAIETKQCLTKKLNAEGKQLINENWEPVNWDKRQYKSDSSKSRVRKYRELQKELQAGKELQGGNSEIATQGGGDSQISENHTQLEEHSGESHAQEHVKSACNADVTPDVTPCNVHVTPPDTDTDTDTDTETEKNSTLPSLSNESSANIYFAFQDFADWHETYPGQAQRLNTQNKTRDGTLSTKSYRRGLPVEETTSRRLIHDSP